MNRYSLAADAVMLFHFCFIAFALLGSLLLIKWPRLIWLHVPALCWGIYIELSGNICPLTPLENHYRELAGQSTYFGGFIAHYIGPIIYPDGLTRTTQIVIFAILVAVNAAGYGFYFRTRAARRARSA